MARNFNRVFALIEYINKTEGYIYRVFENYEEAETFKKWLEAQTKKYEPSRKVTYKIEIYEKRGLKSMNGTT